VVERKSDTTTAEPSGTRNQGEMRIFDIDTSTTVQSGRRATEHGITASLH